MNYYDLMLAFEQEKREEQDKIAEEFSEIDWQEESIKKTPYFWTYYPKALGPFQRAKVAEQLSKRIAIEHLSQRQIKLLFAATLGKAREILERNPEVAANFISMHGPELIEEFDKLCKIQKPEQPTTEDPNYEDEF
jgi:hypothetical protein